MAKFKKAYLVLEDGTVFEGEGFGASVIKSGEVVFNTALSGYQEILSDPSYFGQIVVMTYPHIGNYGLCSADEESKKIYASGLVVREYSKTVSNYRSQCSLDAALKKAKAPGIAEIDTRALVRHIRKAGAMPAVLAVGDKLSLDKLKKMATTLPKMEGQNFVPEVSCKKHYAFTKGLEDFIKEQPMARVKARRRFNVVAYDYGMKHNIPRLLTEYGCDVTVVPHDYPAEKILKSKKKVHGVFLSNGPGDPAMCTAEIENVKKLIGKKPVFGICLGHQIIALALGAKTYKLKFGHHGANHPVMDVTTKKVEITSQNHGFAVDDKSLPSDVMMTHVNLNDNTVEGLRHKKFPVFSVQYHPESAPGPHDSRYLFERFVEDMKK
jgi:carbamoyl-phosphate synthase small subunit